LISFEKLFYFTAMVDFLLSIELCTPVVSRRPCLEGRMLTKVVPLQVLQFAMLTDLVLDDQLFDFKWQRNIVALCASKV